MSLAYFTVTKFRGLWVWSGTFDAYWLPASRWLTPAVAGLVIGSVLSILPAKKTGFSNFTAALCLLGLVLATLVEFIGVSVFTKEIDSVYAPTRPIVLLGVVTVLTAGLYANGTEA
jgi:hypothetical protein